MEVHSRDSAHSNDVMLLPHPARANFKADDEERQHEGSHPSVIVSIFHHKGAVWQHARELLHQLPRLSCQAEKHRQ